MYTSCDCVKRNGLQDNCPRSLCQGRSACMCVPTPNCCPASFPLRYANVTMGVNKRKYGGGGGCGGDNIAPCPSPCEPTSNLSNLPCCGASNPPSGAPAPIPCSPSPKCCPPLPEAGIPDPRIWNVCNTPQVYPYFGSNLCDCLMACKNNGLQQNASNNCLDDCIKEYEEFANAIHPYANRKPLKFSMMPSEHNFCQQQHPQHNNWQNGVTDMPSCSRSCSAHPYYYSSNFPHSSSYGNKEILNNYYSDCTNGTCNLIPNSPLSLNEYYCPYVFHASQIYQTTNCYKCKDIKYTNPSQYSGPFIPLSQLGINEDEEEEYIPQSKQIFGSNSADNKSILNEVQTLNDNETLSSVSHRADQPQLSHISLTDLGTSNLTKKALTNISKRNQNINKIICFSDGTVINLGPRTLVIRVEGNVNEHTESYSKELNKSTNRTIYLSDGTTINIGPHTQIVENYQNQQSLETSNSSINTSQLDVSLQIEQSPQNKISLDENNETKNDVHCNCKINHKTSMCCDICCNCESTCSCRQGYSADQPICLQPVGDACSFSSIENCNSSSDETITNG